jgi:hypothetical protein
MGSRVNAPRCHLSGYHLLWQKSRRFPAPFNVLDTPLPLAASRVSMMSRASTPSRKQFLAIVFTSCSSVTGGPPPLESAVGLCHIYGMPDIRIGGIRIIIV